MLCRQPQTMAEQMEQDIPGTPPKEETLQTDPEIEPGSKRVHKPAVASFLPQSEPTQNGLDSAKQQLDLDEERAQNDQAAAAPEPPVEERMPSVDASFADCVTLQEKQENVLARLAKIRDCKRQVIDMLDTMKHQDPQQLDREMLARLISAYDGFKEQEEQYVEVLQKLLAFRKEQLNEAAAAAAADVESGPEQEEVVVPEPNEDKQDDSSSTEQMAELQALYNQREQLRKMINEQKSIEHEQRDRLERLQEQKRLEEETMQAQQMVNREAESVASKRRELELLREQLSALRGIYAEVVVGGSNSAAESDQQQEQCPAATFPDSEQVLQDKLRALQHKKEHMTEMLKQLSALEEEQEQQVQPDTDDDDGQLPQVVDSVHSQLRELSTVKERLLELQKLTRSAQEAADMEQPLSDDVRQQIAEASAVLSQEHGIRLVQSDAEAAPEEPELRSDLDSLSAHQRALDNLQAERARLAQIKDDYLKLRDAGSGNVYEDHPPLNNNNSRPSANDRESLSARQFHESAQLPPVVNTCRASADTSMVRNPRLASFRRNNQLGSARSHASRHTDNSTPPSRRSSVQDQLHVHFDSIRSIFEQLMNEQQSSGAASARAMSQASEQQNVMWQQQMMLTTSLLQHQMQMQQMEMARLQNTITQLSHQPTAASPQPATVHPPLLMPNFPHQFDGRPLSSASLNNLFAPLPPYMPQFAPMVSPSRPNALNQSWHPTNQFAPQQMPDLAASFAGPIAETAEVKTTDTVESVPRLDLNVSGTSKTRSQRAPKQTNMAPKVKNLFRGAQGTNKHSRNNITEEPGFDSLRESIYSEVAALISQNEQCPEFLMELFRELQLLSNQYLRERALHAIRDLLNRYLTTTTTNTETETEDDVPDVGLEDTEPDSPVGNQTDATVREEGAVESRENLSAVAAANVERSGNVGDKNKSQLRTKRFENFEDIKDVKTVLNNSPDAMSVGVMARKEHIERIRNGTLDPRQSKEKLTEQSSMDMGGLEQQIEAIVDELIPFMKENAGSSCTEQLLQYVRKLVLTLAASKCLPPGAMTDFFHRQLSSILDDTLAKYSTQKLGSCSEEMLTDISEVVFNEMAFFRLMHNIDSRETAMQQQQNRARRVSLMSETETNLRLIENETRSRKNTPQRSLAKSPNMPAAPENKTEANLESKPSVQSDVPVLPSIAAGDSAVTAGGGASARFKASSPTTSPAVEVPEELIAGDNEIVSQPSAPSSSSLGSGEPTAAFNFVPVTESAELSMSLPQIQKENNEGSGDV